MISRHLLATVLALAFAAPLVPAADTPPMPLPGTEPLTWTDELWQRIVGEAHRFLDRKQAESVALREQYWNRDFSSPEAYGKSVEPNRSRLRKILGVVDDRLPAVMERWGTEESPSLVAERERYGVYQVRWQVLDGVYGEGLLLEPVGRAVAHVVAIPDADQTPEQLAGLAAGVEPQSQFARRLAENGFRVVILVLVNRSCDSSGNPQVAMTNQPHREWIYRQAYQMGRHVIGYEIQKVLGAIDWFCQDGGEQATVGVAGYGEGGLVAFYSAAVDPRIDACLVSGYFDSRQKLPEEPIYRNVWSLLREFGDAEIASLIVPRALVVEYSPVPQIDGPPAVPRGRRGGAAPGKLSTPPFESVRGEFRRAEKLDRAGLGKRHLIAGEGGKPVGPGSEAAMQAFAAALGRDAAIPLSSGAPQDPRETLDVARQARQVKQITDHIQLLQRNSDRVRNRFFLELTGQEVKGGDPRVADAFVDRSDAFVEAAQACRNYFRKEVIGWLDDPLSDPNAKTRKIYDEPKWTGYDVVLDVWPELHAWGVLLVPKDLKPDERRPVVVCQHGLEGVPQSTITRDQSDRAYRAYRGFSAELAERGFIVFAPFNLYRGRDEFRMLQRKANPLKASLFSVITRQHEQILNWLASLPYVDPSRIGFYGLSYGGKTAMRVPALLEGYCLSICSADFNDWIRKNVSVYARYSYMFTVEWEMFEFDLGNTFNYAEMAYLIFPRPFMVERGHHDGVAPDWWVAYEYAKIRYHYVNLGYGERTEIEFFNGPHAINGQGTFDFLHKHLKWPKPAVENSQ
jgi:dienelactone hydrolase